MTSVSRGAVPRCQRTKASIAALDSSSSAQEASESGRGSSASAARCTASMRLMISARSSSIPSMRKRHGSSRGMVSVATPRIDWQRRRTEA